MRTKQSNWDRYCRRERLREMFGSIDFSKLQARPAERPGR